MRGRGPIQDGEIYIVRSDKYHAGERLGPPKMKVKKRGSIPPGGGMFPKEKLSMLGESVFGVGVSTYPAKMRFCVIQRQGAGGRVISTHKTLALAQRAADRYEIALTSRSHLT